MTTDRYQRHSLIDWFSQEDVKQASFAIVGCGAVGNEVAKNLALLGIGRLDLYDFDKIEVHNLTRSVLFREGDVGSFKSEKAAARVHDLDPNIEVHSYNGDFWDTLSFDQAKSYDSIICCVDNFEARIRLNQLCYLAQTNLINTGIDSKFGQIEVFPFSSGRHVSCYECNLPNSAYERIQQRYSCGWLKKISFVEKKIPTTIITSSLTGSLAVSSALQLIGNNSIHQATRILIDSFTGRSTVSKIEQNDQCPACSSVNDRVTVIQASAIIDRRFWNGLADDEHYLTTSEPILVSVRCVDCHPEKEDAEIVFERALEFDSTLTTCKECGNDSVDVTIKDSFSLSELIASFPGMKLPSKFVRFDSEDATTIIELE